MEIIPSIHLREREILEKDGSKCKIDGFLEKIESLEKLYIIDHDGIERNKPNLCTYQKLSKSIDIWVDAGPNELGDVVDTIMAGATDITLRKQIWPNLDAKKIKEYAESNLYLKTDLRKQDKYHSQLIMKEKIDGLVILDENNDSIGGATSIECVKSLAERYKMYIYETNQKNLNHWKEIGVNGIIVDLHNLKEFKKYEF